VLLGHIIATKTDNTLVKLGDMEIPENWKDADFKPTGTSVGHQNHGRTLAVHSLAVVPEHQHKGLGRILMKGYQQRIQSAGVADRIVIITYERLVPFYESLGFSNKGKSSNPYGGEEWIDMVCPLEQWDDGEDVDEDD
jgi:ribosomal protein S18 acetylase RimI-like enzyme